MIHIGLSGRKGAGKSTVAHLIRDELAKRQKSCEIIGASEPLVAMAQPLLASFGLEGSVIDHYLSDPLGRETIIPAMGVTGRYILQTLGTEWGRVHISPDLWSEIMRSKATRSSADVVIFDGIRFKEEADMLCGFLDYHAFCVIRRTNLEPDTHESESFLFGDLVENYGRPEECASEIIKEVFG